MTQPQGTIAYFHFRLKVRPMARHLPLLARLALASVWLAEGAGLKLWLHDPTELAVVAASGLYLGSPDATLVAIGVLETLAGFVLLVGIQPRLAVAVPTAAMLAITAGVVAMAPALVFAPLTGVVKNGALVVCGCIVWVHAPAPCSTPPPSPCALSKRIATRSRRVSRPSPLPS